MKPSVRISTPVVPQSIEHYLRGLALHVLFKVYQRTPTLPILIRQVASSMGIKAVYEQPMSKDGALIWHQGEPIIKINSKSSEMVGNFTIAHELAHLILNEEKEAFRRLRISQTRKRNKIDQSLEEGMCDIIASELLMPEHAVRSFLCKEEVRPKLILSMADVFDVSVMAAAHRLTRLPEVRFGCLRCEALAIPKDPNRVLRIRWAVTSPGFGFIPANKTIRSQGLITYTYNTGIGGTSIEKLSLGSLHGTFHLQTHSLTAKPRGPLLVIIDKGEAARASYGRAKSLQLRLTLDTESGVRHGHQPRPRLTPAEPLVQLSLFAQSPAGRTNVRVEA